MEMLPPGRATLQWMRHILGQTERVFNKDDYIGELLIGVTTYPPGAGCAARCGLRCDGVFRVLLIIQNSDETTNHPLLIRPVEV